MDNEEEINNFVVSEEGALEFLQKMVSKGLFHSESQLLPSSDDCSYPDNDIEDMKKFIHREKKEYYADDCDLIFCEDENGQQYVMTRQHLTSQIFQLVNDSGRISLQDVCTNTHVIMKDVKRSVTHLCDLEDSDMHNVGSEIVTEKYLDDKCHELEKNIKRRLQILDIANDWNLPLQFTLETIEKRMDLEGIFSGIKLTVNCNGTKQLVTAAHEKENLRQVEELLKGVEAPTKMGEVMENIQLDPIQVLQHVKFLCNNKTLKGSLHVDDTNVINLSTAFGAFYTPDSYEKNQEKEALSFFDANGFIAYLQAEQMGISHKMLDQCILGYNPRAITLQECLVHPDNVAKTQSLIEDSLEAKSFFEMSTHLPEGISRIDAEALMSEHVFGSIEELEESGFFIYHNSGQTFFFSNGMVTSILSSCIQPLIEDYAKPRAKELADLLMSTDEQVEDDLPTKGRKSRSGKAKNKGDRKRSSKRSRNEFDTIDYGKVPLTSVASAVAEIYSEFAEIQANHSVDAGKGGLSWDNENVDDGGPLFSFCRRAFGNSESFAKDCADAVKVELTKIMEERKGSSLQSREFGAAKSKNIESSFEDAFRTSCQWLQVLAKYPLYLVSSDEESSVVEQAKQDFLNGCAVDFTKRLTEYCLFKYGIDEEVTFQFHHDGQDAHDEGSFHTPVDTTQREFHRVFLSCKSKEEEENPLNFLREYLPGSSGVELARAWKFCGGENYAGGKITTEDDVILSKPGDFERFLSHIEESCLSICNLPFKQLDKKTEKQLLFARKKELKAQLQDSESERDILELSIMLLFQQLKNLAVCGDKITSTTMVEVLVSDKKLPDHVADQLKQAVLFHQRKEEVPRDILSFVKECGLSKDVTLVEMTSN